MKTVVDAQNKGMGLGLKELVKYKDLFLILAYRDFRVRYAQTYLGFIWAFIQPALTLIIFTLVFGKAAKVDTGEIPYPVFAIVGMSAWSYFAFVMSQSGNSIIGAQGMIKKIYFPRLVIPLSKSLVGLIDFGITLCFLVAIMLYYGQGISSSIVLFPLFLLVNLFAALGVGIWLSALTVRYRDFQHIIPFAVQFGLYATPIAYPSSLVVHSLPDWIVALYYLNPMAGVVEGYRLSILGIGEIDQFSYLSFFVVVLLFVSSLYYFKRVERVMADIV
ncbi:MAG: lipopolysaccharide transport system permease protein [Bacteroidia bacterium]|jgi:lipopolysaccharide transport system permease protein